MAAHLNWFGARRLARQGRAVRRDAWRKWITFESYLYILTQPAWENLAADRRVVQEYDFEAAEFLATDWTDEPWPGGPLPPDGGGGTGGGDGGDPLGNNSSGTGTPTWGGDGGGGGAGGGPNNVPPTSQPTTAVPVITVTLTAMDSAITAPDGGSCFTEPPATCAMAVAVSIAGGPAGVGGLHVELQGAVQLANGFDGFNQTFIFSGVAVSPGGTLQGLVRYYADGRQNLPPLSNWWNTGAYTFAPRCSPKDFTGPPGPPGPPGSSPGIGLISGLAIALG